MTDSFIEYTHILHEDGIPLSCIAKYQGSEFYLHFGDFPDGAYEDRRIYIGFYTNKEEIENYIKKEIPVRDWFTKSKKYVYTWIIEGYNRVIEWRTNTPEYIRRYLPSENVLLFYPGTIDYGVGAGYGTIKLLQAAGMRPVDHLYAGARALKVEKKELLEEKEPLVESSVQYAFWKVSHFPYYAGAPINRLHGTGEVSVDGYLGFLFKPVKFLPEAEGIQLVKALKELEVRHREALDSFNETWFASTLKLMDLP